MRILIAGIDGYVGWPLAQHLAQRGHQIAGVDSLFRRSWVKEMGSVSAVPIWPVNDRVQALSECTGEPVSFWEGDLRDYSLVERVFREFEPEAVVHLGECPSVSYSMIDRQHARFVQVNNLEAISSLLFAIRELAPGAHLLRLGDLAGTGAPDAGLPAGSAETGRRGQQNRVTIPQQVPSWYHLSKIHGTANVMLACEIWGLRSTEVRQGVVFGTRTQRTEADLRLRTRLDFDHAFGTAVNRFACQAVIEHPLTPPGSGRQERGFVSLQDSVQCLALDLENPPDPGEHRVVDRYGETYSIRGLAEAVQETGRELGLKAEVIPVENPGGPADREGAGRELHHRMAGHPGLPDPGYQPQASVAAELQTMLEDLLPHRDRIAAHREALMPDVPGAHDTRRRVSLASPDATRWAAPAAGPPAGADAAALWVPAGYRPGTGAESQSGADFLPFHRPCITEEDVLAVRQVLESGWLTHGPRCREFEGTFAENVGAGRAVALSSGTAALHLALVALGAGPGDEVITTPMTFCACAHVIEHVGATPVFADIDPVTMQIDPAQIDRVMTSRTKVVIAVDYGGHPCQIEEIVKMARSRGVAVIEDAAHSLGAAVGGRPVGSIADVTAFSFYATKNITTGEGGMLTTQDDRLAERVEQLRLHGIQRDAWRRYRQGGSWRYDVMEAGFKANLTDFQAALGLSQLRREPAIRMRRERIAAYYGEALAGLGDLVELPAVADGMRSAWHLYPLRLAGATRHSRDQLIADLARRGIGTSVHFIPLHLTSHFRERYGFRGGEFPACEDVGARVISLPLYEALSDTDADRVAAAVTELVPSYARLPGAVAGPG